MSKMSKCQLVKKGFDFFLFVVGSGRYILIRTLTIMTSINLSLHNDSNGDDAGESSDTDESVDINVPEQPAKVAVSATKQSKIFSHARKRSLSPNALDSQTSTTTASSLLQVDAGVDICDADEAYVSKDGRRKRAKTGHPSVKGADHMWPMIGNSGTQWMWQEFDGGPLEFATHMQSMHHKLRASEQKLHQEQKEADALLQARLEREKTEADASLHARLEREKRESSAYLHARIEREKREASAYLHARIERERKESDAVLLTRLEREMEVEHASFDTLLQEEMKKTRKQLARETNELQQHIRDSVRLVRRDSARLVREHTFPKAPIAPEEAPTPVLLPKRNAVGTEEGTKRAHVEIARELTK
jgi:hypothetical protein